jgi:hypothetical protein
VGPALSDWARPRSRPWLTTPNPLCKIFGEKQPGLFFSHLPSAPQLCRAYSWWIIYFEGLWIKQWLMDARSHGSRTLGTKAAPAQILLRLRLCIRRRRMSHFLRQKQKRAPAGASMSSSQTVYIPELLYAQSVRSISRKSNVCNRRISFARRHSLPLSAQGTFLAAADPSSPFQLLKQTNFAL